MKIIQKKIGELKFAEYNARKMDARDLAHLRKSLEGFGVVEPAVVNVHPDRTNVIIGGHQRIRVAKEMGWKTFPCFEVDLPIERERELNIRLNRNVGEWDAALLAQNFDLESLMHYGFNPEDDELRNLLIDEKPAQDDIPPIPSEARTKIGDLYELGHHKLICGDATDEATYRTLLGHIKVSLMFMSPPYDNDELYEVSKTRTDYKMLVSASSACWSKIVEPGGLIVLNVGNKVGLWNALLWGQALTDLDFRFVRRIVWKKPDGVGYPSQTVMQRYGWGLQYTPRMITEDLLVYAQEMPEGFSDEAEDIIVMSQGRRRPPDRSARLDRELAWKFFTDVWEIKPVRSDKEQRHPTAFPVQLATNVISFYSLPNEAVIDPFVGSGTTIIAAEQMHRRAYAIELDPRFCDVAVDRYCKMTSKTTVKLNGTEIKWC